MTAQDQKNSNLSNLEIEESFLNLTTWKQKETFPTWQNQLWKPHG